jgi:hypothetical protein
MKVILGHADTFNVWQAISGATWEDLEIEQGYEDSGSIQFWNQVFESKINRCKTHSVGPQTNSIGPGNFGSSHSYITKNIIIQYGIYTTPGWVVGFPEGAEDAHLIGNTIINLSTYASNSPTIGIGSAVDVTIQGNSVYSPLTNMALDTSSGSENINIVTNGNTFVGGEIKLGGFNDNFSGNNCYNISGLCLAGVYNGASVTGNNFYSNNAPTWVIIIENQVGAFSSNLVGNTIINSGTAGTMAIYVNDPGSPQTYPLTIVGNNIQGFTTKIAYAGSADANLPNKKIWGNPGVADVSPNNLSIAGGSANHAICWKADGKTLGYCSVVVDASGICGTCQ